MYVGMYACMHVCMHVCVYLYRLQALLLAARATSLTVGVWGILEDTGSQGTLSVTYVLRPSKTWKKGTYLKLW